MKKVKREVSNKRSLTIKERSDGMEEDAKAYTVRQDRVGVFEYRRTVYSPEKEIGRVFVSEDFAGDTVLFIQLDALPVDGKLVIHVPYED